MLWDCFWGHSGGKLLLNPILNATLAVYISVFIAIMARVKLSQLQFPKFTLQFPKFTLQVFLSCIPNFGPAVTKLARPVPMAIQLVPGNMYIYQELNAPLKDCNLSNNKNCVKPCRLYGMTSALMVSWYHRRLQARAYPGIVRVISNHVYSHHEEQTRRHVVTSIWHMRAQTYLLYSVASGKTHFPQLRI